MNRRTFLSLTGSTLIPCAAAERPDRFRTRIATYLEQHRRPEGAYAWSSDLTPQLTPTFAVVGCYHLLGLSVPDAAAIASFVRNGYPVPDGRRKSRPLWRFDFEQVQALLWLGESIESFRELASMWNGPAEFTKAYELDGNPVFQHQAMAVRVRRLLNIASPDATAAWRDYFMARRRDNGTFNNTPASDGSGGHVMNTLWGLLATECLDIKESIPAALAEWVKSCQLPSGGFTWSPGASIGGVDDVAYTWCALQILEKLHARPNDARRCAAWIESLQTSEGGFQDRPGGEPNPLATFYALDSLRMLGHVPSGKVKTASRARRTSIHNGAKVFAIQVQAPGNGSPRDAVLLAKSLGIHLWTAKNSPQGWIEEAQRLADADNARVRFMIGNEEYGTYYAVPGLGCYSHLVDTLAPAHTDSGQQLPKQKHPYSFNEFRDTRVAALRKGGGRLVWQFNENEEITRVLLDEALRDGTYSAICAYHMGNENFLQTQPFLHRWYGRMPFVALQDAHGKESWWFGDQLSGFTTLFIAREQSWDAWLEALDKNLVMSVRHDAVTKWRTELAGGSPELRDFVMKRQREWRWWDDAGAQSRRPCGSLVLLRPGMRFEVGVPEQGLALRLRLWADNVNMGLPRAPRTELLQLRVDGTPVTPRLHEASDDRYYHYAFDTKPGAHSAEADVRVLDTGTIRTISAKWNGD